MYRSAFEQPLSLRLGRSRALAAALAAIHGGAVVPALMLPWPAWARALVLGCLGWSWWSTHRRHVLVQGDAVSSLLLKGDGGFELELGGRTLPARLERAELVQWWLTVLLFRLGDGRRRAVLLLPDNVEADAFRRLRARLRCGRAAAAGGAPGAGP